MDQKIRCVEIVELQEHTSLFSSSDETDIDRILRHSHASAHTHRVRPAPLPSWSFVPKSHSSPDAFTNEFFTKSLT